MVVLSSSLLYFLIISQTVSKANTDASQPVVKTSYGEIRGKVLKTIQKPHLEYLAFKGIPYAKPPLKNLRFKPPVKPEPWKGVKSCEEFGSPCLQISKTDQSVQGNEDCLTLNVFTKELNTTNLKPVMFWIHGGAYKTGSSSKYGPDYLLEKSIVLVTINYRLNIFGFLTVGDDNVFGNTATKDQIAALEWVQTNIKNFGGDPSNVTIFGQSAGANSVSLLHLSSRTKGLYHRMIAQSGSALNSRYVQRDPVKYVYNIANYLKVSTRTAKDIVEGLQKIDAEELTKAANDSDATGYCEHLQAAAFYPVIEVENPEAIITRGPFELMKTGKFNQVPYIIGYNTNEGTLGLEIVDSEMDIDDFNKRYELFAPLSLNLKDKEKKVEVGKIVREYFLGNSSARNDKKFSKFLKQEVMVRGIRKTIDFQRKYSQGYFYRFAYEGSNTTKQPGVGHSEELQYIFAIEDSYNEDEDDILTQKRMVEMWTNFATFGFPIPKDGLLSENVSWKKCERNGPVNFLNIGAKLTEGRNPDEEAYAFWKGLFDKFGIEPYITY